MIRCAGLSGLRKSLGWVITPFFCGKKNIYVHKFLRFNCLLSSGLGAVKSLPDFNVKSIIHILMMEFFEHPGATPIVDGYFPCYVD